MIPFINDPFAKNVGIQPIPVPLIPFDPFEGPLASISVNCAWLAIVQGTLRELLQEAVWDTTDPNAKAEILGRVQQLITLFATAQQTQCGGAPAVSCPFNFQDAGVGPGGFINLDESPYIPNFIGVFQNLLGWTGSEADSGGVVEKGITIYRTFSPAITINSINFVYSLVKGSFSKGTGTLRDLLQISAGGVPLATSFIYSDADSDGTDKELSIGGVYTIDRVDLRVHSCWKNNPAEASGDCAITQFNYNLNAPGPCPP